MTKRFNQPQQQPFAAMHFVDEAEKKSQRNAEAALKKEEAVQRQWESNLKKAAQEAQKKAEADEIKANRQWESNFKKAAREAQKKAQAAEVEAMKSARTLAQIDM